MAQTDSPVPRHPNGQLHDMDWGTLSQPCIPPRLDVAPGVGSHGTEQSRLSPEEVRKNAVRDLAGRATEYGAAGTPAGRRSMVEALRLSQVIMSDEWRVPQKYVGLDTVLSSIAGTHPDPAVRTAAAEWIHDSSALKPQILGGDHDDLIRLVGEQTTLAEIASHARFAHTRAQAFDKLTDAAAIVRVLSVDESIAESGMKKLRLMGRQDILVQHAKSHSSGAVRLSAIVQLRDAQCLIDIATSSVFAKEREAAVGNLHDQSVLTQIAETDEDAGVRRAAVYSLSASSQTALLKIAQTDRDTNVCEAAASRLDLGTVRDLRDSGLLAMVIRSHGCGCAKDTLAISLAAIERISSRSLMASLVKWEEAEERSWSAWAQGAPDSRWGQGWDPTVGNAIRNGLRLLERWST